MEWLVPFVGTLVTVAGLVVAAPYAAGRMLPDAWLAIRHRGHRVRARVSQWLPWATWPPAEPQPGSNQPQYSDSKVGFAIATIQEAEGPHPDAPLVQQIAGLWRGVTEIRRELHQIADRHREAQATLSERLNQVSAELVELRQHIQAQEDQARQLDARGLPLAAVGALVAGLPGTPLTWWWWTLLAIGVMAGLVAVHWLRERGPTGFQAELAMGWKAASASSPSQSQLPHGH